MKIFIQSNRYQFTAAKVAKFSFEKFGYTCKIVNIEDEVRLKKYFDKKYLRNNKIKTFKDDLQSFTLLRFLIPELVDNNEKIMIIDPDVFALKSLNKLEEITNNQNLIYCTFYNNKPRSEVMIGYPNILKINFDKYMEKLFNFKVDYMDIMGMNIYNKKSIVEIPKIYNQHDHINNNTCILHTTQRITQPWKYGLKIDFERHIGKKLLLINYIKKLLFMKYNKNFLSSYYLKHGDDEVFNFIINLFNNALSKKIISNEELIKSMELNYIGKKFVERLNIAL